MNVCAVIPAAGRGSRLGGDLPKLLVPVTERETIWSVLRAKLEGLVDHIHVIVSPAGLDALQPLREEFAGRTPVSIGIQPEPIGMGDAIFCGFPVWSQAKTVVVLWGDQVHVARETLRRGLELHRNAQNRIVLPLVALPEPYVEYCFEPSGRLMAVRQTREGDRCRPGGLGDVGTFILSTAGLGSAWARFLEARRVGAVTGDINFLPFLVFLAQRGWEVKRFEVADPVEARGINTPADLAFFRDLYERQHIPCRGIGWKPAPSIQK